MGFVFACELDPQFCLIADRVINARGFLISVVWPENSVDVVMARSVVVVRGGIQIKQCRTERILARHEVVRSTAWSNAVHVAITGNVNVKASEITLPLFQRRHNSGK